MGIFSLTIFFILLIIRTLSLQLKQKERRPRAEKKEVICQSKGLVSGKNSLTNFLTYLRTSTDNLELLLLQLHWKQSHEGYHKYKKEDSAPFSARPGHIRFEPLDEGLALILIQIPVLLPAVFCLEIVRLHCLLFLLG